MTEPCLPELPIDQLWLILEVWPYLDDLARNAIIDFAHELAGFGGDS
jgi:hypothetical protein